MGSKKPTSTTNTATTTDQSQSGTSRASGSNNYNSSTSYAWSPERTSQDIEAIRALGAPPESRETDFAAASQLGDIDKAFGSVTSAYGTPELDAQRKLGMKEGVRQKYAAQKQSEGLGRYRENLSRLQGLAGLTAPVREQTGTAGSQNFNSINEYFNKMTGTGTSTGKEQVNPGGSFLGNLFGNFI